MRTSKILILAAFFAMAALVSTAFIVIKPAKKANSDNKGFAVVELYTSEGCSSCPPADELVARVLKETRNEPVYILAYHVDYWNRLGWKDQFSSAAFSQRQNEYANYLNLQSVYTPQIIVNGRKEFVGSENGTLHNAIKTALQKTSATQLTLTAVSVDQNKAVIKYDTEGADSNTALMVAVLQKAAQTNVESGENGGRTLSHVQIVRKLQDIPLAGHSGTANIALPHGFDSRSWEIIGFLQNTSNGAISGAARAALNDVNSSASAVQKSSK